MLRASVLEITLSAADLSANLIRVHQGRIADPEISLMDGAMRVRMRVASERLSMTVPVHLTLSVRSVDGMTVELGVAWSNLPLLPGMLKEAALQRAFEALPGEYDNGVLRIDLVDVLADLPATFTLRSVQITAEAVQVSLEDVLLFEPEADAESDLPIPLEVAGPEADTKGYYDRLRERVHSYAAQRAPRWVQPLMPWVLAVPDLFVLVGRLAKHPRVPASAKVVAAGVLTYFLTPIDIIPDVIPLLGQVDDVAVALFAIEHLSTRVPVEVIQDAWPGEGQVIDWAKDGVSRFSKALPARALGAIKKRIRRFAQ